MERRVVSAVFVDVVDSTALTVRLGPERFKRALDHAFVDLMSIIEGEGGTIANLIGDAIFALFGLPMARPDDPIRALRAAQACTHWADDRGGSSIALAVRIGVETGEVLVDPSDEEHGSHHRSVGNCVNLAARLQQLAGPGQILVGPTCHEITEDLATFAAMGSVDLKGLGQQQVWRLATIRDLPVRPTPPFVGREADLALLRVAHQRARSGRNVLAVVSGPPGQGKTRLVEEFLAQVGGDTRVLRARCRPAGEPSARNPLRELLTSDAVDRSVETLSDRLVALFPDLLERDRVFAALAHSAGISVSQELAALPADQRQDEIENGWRRYLAALARDRPLVLWLDDVHWAEPELVRLVDQLTLGADMPALVIATARPEFARHAGVRAGGDRFFIDLAALNDGDARALALHAGAAPAGLERAEGNPLFIIELARAHKISAAPEVPLTLKGIIGARLDELPREDRELLQRVAVVGETFSLNDAMLLSGREPADAASALDRLAGLSCVRPVRDGYRFHHALVYDVAYARLATAERMRLHALYAERGVPQADVETLAHHLWEAAGLEDAAWVWEGSEELAPLRDRARQALIAASRRYTDRGAFGRAIEAAGRALLLASDPKDGAAVAQIIGDVYAAQGDAEQAWTHYMQARERYRDARVDAPANLYPSLLELRIYTSGMFSRLPDAALVEVLFQEGEDAVRRAGDAASLARLLALRAYGSLDAMQMSKALRVSKTLVDAASLRSSLEHAAILQIRLGDFKAAQHSYERLDSLATPGVTTDRQLEYRGILALNIGRIEEAEDVAARYLAIGESRGPHLRTHAYREQCHVLLARGDWRGLRQLAADTERLVSEHPETSFCFAVSTALAFAAVASAVEGDDEHARHLFSRAQMPMQAEPLERESLLLLASGAIGRTVKVDEIRRLTRQQYPKPLWYFHRMEAVVLTMLERWDEVGEVLPHLEHTAGKSGSRYLAALVAAIGEEIDAARGGPAATHAMLRQLGYLGWSRLLSYRPNTE